MSALFGWLNGSGNTHSQEETTAADVLQRLAQGEDLFLLDVREPREYRDAHVPGSKLIPLHELSRKLDAIPRNKPVVAICRSGNRSDVAAMLLRRAGYTRVQNLTGGIIAWARSGGEVARGA